jgi:hypothetical protein
MNWKQIQAEAVRLVKDVTARQSDLKLTEYHNEKLYKIHHPNHWSKRVHNAIVRAAMREAVPRDLFCI